jgi:predicted secreted protein
MNEMKNVAFVNRMKKVAVVAGVAAVVMLGSRNASAADSSGALTVTGTVESSISLTIESAGGTTSGTGTAAATSALGNISKYGSAPTGFTLARGASDWTLSSTVGVKVDKANLTSTDYTLTAQLGSAPASGVTWKLNGSTLSDSSATTLTSTGTYASTGSYSWDIVVADSAAAAAVDNTINFTATSN